MGTSTGNCFPTTLAHNEELITIVQSGLWSAEKQQMSTPKKSWLGSQDEFLDWTIFIIEFCETLDESLLLSVPQALK